LLKAALSRSPVRQDWKDDSRADYAARPSCAFEQGKGSNAQALCGEKGLNAETFQPAMHRLSASVANREQGRFMRETTAPATLRGQLLKSLMLKAQFVIQATIICDKPLV
jgi:hypothetical protein